jgi:hypothetical protein
VNQWIIGCSRIYRRLARAFPHEFRMLCGDGLEQLGADTLSRLFGASRVSLDSCDVLRILLGDCRWNTYLVGPLNSRR